MDQTQVVRGRYSGRTFIPDEPLPEAEGVAQLVITTTVPQSRGSIVDVFGTATVLRSGEELLAELRAERDEWGDR